MPVVETSFRVLGPVEARRADAPLPVGRGHVAAILAVLLLSANHPVPVRGIAARVWGSGEPVDTRTLVYTGISRLRALLGPGLIETHEAGYLLRTDAEHLDLLRFDQLTAAGRIAEGTGDVATAVALFGQALALWREPVLGGVEAPFAAEACAQLTERYLRACELRAAWCLRLGRHETVTRDLSVLVRAHPTRAKLAGRLMLALYRSERRPEALAVYGALRASLGPAVGGVLEADGMREVNELHVKILRDDVSLLGAVSGHGTRTGTGAGADGVGVGDAGADGLGEVGAGASTGAGALAEAEVGTLSASLVRQLPGGTGRFTGRQRELDALDALLAEHPPGGGRSLVVAFDGTAGVGKTAIAVRWAHSVADRFGGGQLYVNLHGYDVDAPTGAAGVLESFLLALGHSSDSIPDELGARAAMFRTATAGRRILVLADNARDSRHVRPLLPGPDCLLVTTSRDQLRGLIAVDGAHRLTVAKFPRPDAVALLGRIVGDERVRSQRQASETLVDLCARSPLAVAIAAEYAQRQPDTPLADLAEQLRGEQSRLDALSADDDSAADLRAVFAWSYRHLSAPAARMFRLLSLHPPSDGIALRAAAALSNGAATQTAVAARLDELVAAHLLESHGAWGRYAMHDLLRDYARDLARREESDLDATAASARLAAWYLGSATHAQNRLRPGGASTGPGPAQADSTRPMDFADYKSALAWFDGEYANLVATIRQNAGAGMGAGASAGAGTGVGADAVRTAADLLWQLRAYYANRQHWAEWAELCRLVFGVDALRDARTFSGLATAYMYQRRLDDALAWYERALAVVPGDHQGPERAMILSQIGLARLSAGDGAGAVEVLHEALASPWADGLPVFLNLSGAYGVLGKFEDALEYAQRAFEQHLRRGEQDTAARALCNIAEAQLCLGRHDPAVAACQQAARICRGIGNVDGEVTALLLLGRVSRDAGDDAGAREALNGAVKLLEGLGAGDSGQAREARATLAELDAERDVGLDVGLDVGRGAERNDGPDDGRLDGPARD